MTTTVLSEEATQFASREHRMLIGGERVAAIDGESLDVIDPASGRVFATVPAGGASDIDSAVRAAREALPAWRELPPARRAELMWNLGTRVAQLADEFATIEAMDN